LRQGQEILQRQPDRFGERSNLTHQRREVIRRDDGGRVIYRSLIVI
jgi:hypothetical protein